MTKKIKLSEELNCVLEKKDFSKFIHYLISDFKNNPNDWENQDLASFLEAIAAWVDDMDGFYANQGKQVPQEIHWRIFADIFYAARVYE